MARYQDAILRRICERHDHPTADQIYLDLKQEYPSVVMATIYNNLNAMSAKGLIRRIKSEGSADRFDSSAPHDHLVCQVCGRLSDIELPNLSEELSRLAQADIDSYDLRMYWTCPQCRQAQKDDQESSPCC